MSKKAGKEKSLGDRGADGSIEGEDGADPVEIASRLMAGVEDIRAEIIVEPQRPGQTSGDEEVKAMKTAKAKSMAELQLEDFEQDIKARKSYANRIFCLIVGWLVSVLLILILHGFLSRRDIVLNFRAFSSDWKTAIHFELSDGVILALIGGTTASVLGLFVIVAQYLFPKRGGDK